jgi:hypothetical protein
MNRREFLTTSAAIAAVSALSGQVPENDANGPGLTPRRSGSLPIVHTTDLFRPHDDPDDHWDLACLYALAKQGYLDLRAVIIDSPPAGKRGDPDVMAVAQMNYLTGKNVPLLIGPATSAVGVSAARLASPQNGAGSRELLEILRRSAEPVAISIGGSSECVALALQLEPALFATKCAGIYLNAGFGAPSPVGGAGLEANVNAHPASYAALFKSPCPLYWMPCFEGAWKDFRMSEWGTYFRIRQGDVLPRLSEPLQNYFAMVARDGVPAADNAAGPTVSPNWLRYLLGPKDETISAKLRASGRNMWCTAGLLQAAGLSVTLDGKIVPQGSVPDPAFEMIPIKVDCSPEGITHWTKDDAAKNRFVIHVRDVPAYGTAMAAALKSLLVSMG